MEEIIEYINTGVAAIEKHLDIFTEQEKEDYHYMINNIEVLINIAKKTRELEEMLKNRIKYTNELEKDLFENASNYVIPKSKVKEKIEEIKGYRDLAKEQIEEKVIIADSDSLNYGRAEAHNKDIQVLQELMEG